MYLASFSFAFFFFFPSLSLPNDRIIAYAPFRVFGPSKIWEAVETCVGLFVIVWGDAAEFKLKERKRKRKRKINKSGGVGGGGGGGGGDGA